MDIIFSDNHLFVVNKLAGVVTQQSGLEDEAKAWIKREYNKPGKVFLEAVHRLDKCVSGVVIFGRTSKALSRMNEFIRNRECRKKYLALVEGALPDGSGTLCHNVRHGSHRAHIDSGGKKAELNYRVIDSFKERTLVEIELITGRYHQIRVQMAAVGCPVVGDEKYGSENMLGPKGTIMLHHAEFTVPHPISREECVFSAEPPHYFQKYSSKS